MRKKVAVLHVLWKLTPYDYGNAIHMCPGLGQKTLRFRLSSNRKQHACPKQSYHA